VSVIDYSRAVRRSVSVVVNLKALSFVALTLFFVTLNAAFVIGASDCVKGVESALCGFSKFFAG